MTLPQLQAEAQKEFENILFPSKENDGIEHVDDSYEGFMKRIDDFIAQAYGAGRSDAVDYIQDRSMQSAPESFLENLPRIIIEARNT